MSVIASTEEIKEVFAYYGRAMYHSQCLEMSIVCADLLLNVVPNQFETTPSPEEWGNLVRARSNKLLDSTLGNIIKDVTKTAKIDEEIRDKLKKALDARNYLAHNFFREKSDGFKTSASCKEMRTDINNLLIVISEASEAIERQLQCIRAELGMPEHGLADIYVSMRESFANGF